MPSMRRILQVYIVNLHPDVVLGLFLIFLTLTGVILILLLIGGFSDYSVALAEGALLWLGRALVADWFLYSIFFLDIIVEVLILRIGCDRAAIITLVLLLLLLVLVLLLASLVR